MKDTYLLLLLVVAGCALRLGNRHQAASALEHHALSSHHQQLPIKTYPTTAQFLAKIPPGPTVVLKDAYTLRDFFNTPMGNAVLKYMNKRAVQPDGSVGFNRYKLSDSNFLLWMAIKIISDDNNDMYLRSLALDQNLYN
jgi:hypothetical protein